MHFDEMKEIAQTLFGHLLERDRKAIVSLWNGEHCHCFSTVCAHQLYDVMQDVGKRLSMMPPSLPELVEGHHLVKSADATDDIALEVAMKIPPQYESIVVVFGDKGDSVFCLGSPLHLTFLAIRSSASAEEASGGPFVNLIEPTGQN